MVKKPLVKAGDVGLITGLGRSPGGKKQKPTPVLLPGKSHGQRRLAGYSPWGYKTVRQDIMTKQQTISHLIMESEFPQSP